MSKKVKNLVVDTTAFIKNVQLQVNSDYSSPKFNF